MEYKDTLEQLYNNIKYKELLGITDYNTLDEHVHLEKNYR